VALGAGGGRVNAAPENDPSAWGCRSNSDGSRTGLSRNANGRYARILGGPDESSASVVEESKIKRQSAGKTENGHAARIHNQPG